MFPPHPNIRLCEKLTRFTFHGTKAVIWVAATYWSEIPVSFLILTKPGALDCVAKATCHAVGFCLGSCGDCLCFNSANWMECTYIWTASLFQGVSSDIATKCKVAWREERWRPSPMPLPMNKMAAKRWQLLKNREVCQKIGNVEKRRKKKWWNVSLLNFGMLDVFPATCDQLKLEKIQQKVVSFGNFTLFGLNSPLVWRVISSVYGLYSHGFSRTSGSVIAGPSGGEDSDLWTSKPLYFPLDVFLLDFGCLPFS